MVKNKVGRAPSRRVKRALHMAVVPHRHNDYRPHFIRLPSVLLIVFSVFMFQMAYNFSQTGSVLGQTIDITTRDLLARTNQVRLDNGASTLRVNPELSQAAHLKIEDMFANQYWAHTSPSGATPWTWFKQAGYQYEDAGENLARDFRSTGGVITAWMNSDNHRANMLDGRFQEVGFAVKSGQFNGEPATLVVALYGKPADAATVAGATTTAAASAVGGQSLITRVGVGLQSMTPALVGSIFLLALVAIIGVIAHGYRDKLPYSWRRSWRRHHGAYTALSALSLSVVVLTLYGGGQI